MQQETSNKNKATGVRWGVLALIFVSSLFAYLDRINFSVCAQQLMELFNITKLQFGYIGSCFFAAYALMQIPGGMLSDKFGIRSVGAFSLIFFSVATFLTPFAWSFVALIALRMFVGAGEGPLYPNVGATFSKWFNSTEKGITSAMLLVGTFLGPAIGAVITVFVSTNFGWRWSFYSYGILGVLIGLAWFFYVRNRPNEHPTINDAEIEYITGKSRAALEATKPAPIKTPWKNMLSVPRFWAFGLCYFATNYTMYLFLTWIPVYLSEARGGSFKLSGLYASLPWLCMCVSVFLAGKWSDASVRKGEPKSKARTRLGFIGMMGCAFGLYAATKAVSIEMTVAMLCVCMTFLGLNYIGIWSSSQDLGSKYAAATTSWMNSWGQIGGIIAPTLTAIMQLSFGWDGAFAFSACIPVLGFITWFFINPDKPIIQEQEAI
ncbi:MFS transporter [Deferribacterales bacterium RsTz2092]|nr:MFS transporter [Deferribacterales bacterium]